MNGLDTRSDALLLNRRDAARLLAISERTLWTLTNTGAIPCVRIGRSVRYSPDDLQRYVERQREGERR